MQAARMIGSRAAWKAAARVMLALTTMVAPAGAQERGGSGQQAEPDPLKWRFMGPSVGNRIAAVAGVPGDPTIYYAGAASGGVWKSTDSGATFAPIFDGQPCRGDRRACRRADRPQHRLGRHRRSMGDSAERRHRRRHLQVHRRRRDVDAHGPRRNRPHRPHHRPPSRSRTSSTPARWGASRVRSRSAACTRRPTAVAPGSAVLFVDANTGCSGLSMDARNPDVLFAGTWQVEMHPWAMLSGGPGSGIYVTTRRRRHVDPRDAQRAAQVAASARSTSPLRPPTPAASTLSFRPPIRAHSGARTTAARAWKVVSWDRALIGRAGYYIRLGISPVERGRSPRRQQQLASLDRRRRHLPAVGRLRRLPRHLVRSDERRSLRDDRRRRDADHDEPRSESMARIRLPIGQMYHVAVDNQVPYYIYSNMQDNGTMRGPEQLAGGRRKQRARAPSGPAADAAGRWRRARRRGCAVGSRARRLRVRIHRSRSVEPGHRVGLVLRQQADAVRREAGDRALGRRRG